MGLAALLHNNTLFSLNKLAKGRLNVTVCVSNYFKKFLSPFGYVGLGFVALRSY